MVDATCNWYGTSNGATIATLVNGSVTYVPFLVDGTDSAPATSGFQPVTGACSGCTTASVSFDIGGIPGGKQQQRFGGIDHNPPQYPYAMAAPMY